MADAQLWTLDQLTELVESALSVGYTGPLNGRVRAVPDQRAIRWYATIGLLDKPAELRGRTALYARRHLLQLVAIKRRQAAGRSLAEIQAELTGATDGTLAEIAAIPDDLPATSRRDRFWSAAPLDAQSPSAAPAAPVAAAPAEPVAATPVAAVRLGRGVTLVLDTASHLSADDLAALHTAAADLLAALADRNLVPPADHSGESA
jgi:DNA-binding transcriptional MerR regulator